MIMNTDKLDKEFRTAIKQLARLQAKVVNHWKRSNFEGTLNALGKELYELRQLESVYDNELDKLDSAYGFSTVVLWADMMADLEKENSYVQDRIGDIEDEIEQLSYDAESILEGVHDSISSFADIECVHDCNL